jgi:hypothetical protein
VRQELIGLTLRSALWRRGRSRKTDGHREWAATRGRINPCRAHRRRPRKTPAAPIPKTCQESITKTIRSTTGKGLTNRSHGRVVTQGQVAGGIASRSCYPTWNLCVNVMVYLVGGQRWTVTVTEHADSALMCKRFVCSYNATCDVGHCINFDTGAPFTVIRDSEGSPKITCGPQGGCTETPAGRPPRVTK